MKVPACSSALTLALVASTIPCPTASSQTVLYSSDGDSAGDWYGTAVSSAGDMNGDGYADWIVGAWRDDNSGPQSGSARILSGADGSILYSFDGDSPNDLFGRSVSGAGDVNADGLADVIVGAPWDDDGGADSGSARVFSGLDGGILYTFHGDSPGDFFGFSVSGAGDVDGDGYDDLIVGAPWDDNTATDSGSARVFSGMDGSILFTFNGDSAVDRFGRAVSGAGDVNGDGRADLIVGAYRDDNNGTESGSARVFSGVDGSILYTFDGDSAGDEFGFSVGGAGDVDGDGRADLIVGAYADDNNGAESGSARVFSGMNGIILYTFNGDSPGDFLGRSVSGAGDLDGDGLADLIAGAPRDDNNGSDSGSIRAFSGASGSILYTFDGGSAGDQLGESVSGGHDVNGDGFDDSIAGAPFADINGADSGSAWVVTGQDVIGTTRANADHSTAQGTIASGSFLSTHASDNIYEQLREEASSGNPARRRSRLSHVWTAAVTPSSNYTFHVEAFHTGNNEGDDFDFAYSRDGSTYTYMLTIGYVVDGDAEQLYNFTEDISGTLYIRVEDRDQTPGNAAIDSIFIDHLYVLSDFESDTTAPSAPTGLSAIAGDGTVLLDWDDNTEPDLADYAVFRSTTLGGPYAPIGTSLLSSNFTDTSAMNGLAYFYVATAVDLSGNESNFSAEVTATPSAGGATSMHIDSITLTTVNVGHGNKLGRADVVILDALGSPVVDASVMGAFTGAYNETFSAITDASGRATLTTSSTEHGGVQFGFCVDTVTHATLGYTGTSNVETCDSF